ncbi:DUF1501 domain-containing protein [Rubritalea tangerina]|uniref:DUF1501 domain-containing protein n=1 Tax=Rubritalea tangerina TaxID=430798 RepID=A0ABW4Z8T6_9BACT
MRPSDKEAQQSRRHFLRQSACASLGVTGLVNALAQVRLMTAAIAAEASSTPSSDYKALVCLFLAGGNDSYNMLVPIGDPSSDEARADYEAARGILALDRNLAHPLNTPTAAPDTPTDAFKKHYASAFPPLGTHPNAQGLADLYNAGELAFVCNVGTLAYPIPTRGDFVNETIPVPHQLFSHSDQQTQWQSSIADKPFSTGWGGRTADLLNASYNPNSKVSMSISIDGINSFQVGTAGGVTQYAVNPSGTVSLSGFGTNYSNAYNIAGDPNSGYKDNDTGRRLKAFEDIMRLTHENLLEDQYNKIVQSARDNEGIIGASLTAAATTGVDFDSHFLNAQTDLGDQLKMVAKLIAGRDPLGNNRQIFFVQIGGFDTHQSMLDDHANLMDELSQGLVAFRNALKDPSINAFDKVVTFTASDFARTLTPNGQTTADGSDHAWGGNAIVMGGPVQGRNLYGHFPSLKVGDATGSIDSHSSRGRLIPDTSVDQYSAVLSHWFGIDSSALDAILPNLHRFDNPISTSSANLNFL